MISPGLRTKSSALLGECLRVSQCTELHNGGNSLIELLSLDASADDLVMVSNANLRYLFNPFAPDNKDSRQPGS